MTKQLKKKKLEKVIDNLNDRQEMVYDLVQERSAKDIPTTYNDVAPLLEGIEDANRQARKTLTQLEKHKLIIGDLKVRNKVETKWYWIKELVQEPQDSKDLHISIGLVFNMFNYFQIMQIPILGKLILLFALYCISDLSIKRNILRKAVRRANRARSIF